MLMIVVHTADRHRPYLMTRVQGTNDYINAVFVDVSLTVLFCDSWQFYSGYNFSG